MQPPFIAGGVVRTEKWLGANRPRAVKTRPTGCCPSRPGPTPSKC